MKRWRWSAVFFFRYVAALTSYCSVRDQFPLITDIARLNLSDFMKEGADIARLNLSDQFPMKLILKVKFVRFYERRCQCPQRIADIAR